MKIAIASSDGKNLDLHFGKAKSLYIFDFNGKNEKFLEKRTVEFVEDQKHQWMKTLKAIEDCDVVICVQAGLKSKCGIEESGIKLVEDEGPVDEVLKRYIDHYKFMNSSL
jgi:predicted Fe-Mo cluster-binding NifX family protein